MKAGRAPQAPREHARDHRRHPGPGRRHRRPIDRPNVSKPANVILSLRRQRRRDLPCDRSLVQVALMDLATRVSSTGSG